MRTVWQKDRLFMVDRRARNTLNALSAGYAREPQRGGKLGADPEPGVSRILAEAIEACVAMITRVDDAQSPKGAHMAVNAKGASYITANPGAR
jgi:hypothetical protein